MTEQTAEPDEGEPGGGQYDAPNQEVVGIGPPWEEGDGGPEIERPQPEDPNPEADAEPEADADPLDAMTKDELIEEAGRRGIDVNQAWTKAEIRAAIDSG